MKPRLPGCVSTQAAKLPKELGLQMCPPLLAQVLIFV